MCIRDRFTYISHLIKFKLVFVKTQIQRLTVWPETLGSCSFLFVVVGLWFPHTYKFLHACCQSLNNEIKCGGEDNRATASLSLKFFKNPMLLLSMHISLKVQKTLHILETAHQIFLPIFIWTERETFQPLMRRERNFFLERIALRYL